jgi:hypothetical protein
MKKFYSIFLGAVFSLLAVSCFPETEQDNWTPGEAEDAFCYGVYFPVQDASGYHIYNPTQEPKVVITVGRTNTSGAITVPVEATFSEEGIFEATPIAFEDGQAETTFTVSFPTAKEGTEYSASFNITDKTYASLYSSNAVGLDFSFMRVEMLEFKNPATKETANFTLNEGWWGEVHTAKLQYYEVDGVRTCTFISTEDGNGIWGDTVNATLQFKWYTKDNNSEGNNLLEVPKQYFGFDYSDWGSKPVGEAVNPVYVYDYYWYHIERATSGIDQFTWMDFAKKYGDPDGGYPIGYYDGNGGFYFNLRYYIPGLGGFSPDPYEFVAICDGFVRVDYSLDIATDYPADGVTPLYVETGVDVKSVKYAIYEGSLNSAQQEAKLSGIVAGTEEVVTFTEFAYDADENVNYATIGLSPEKTATYTLIMVACDAEDNVQNSASLTFNHVNATDNDDYAVEVNAFTEDTPARYAELHAYDSFAYCVYGKDLTEVHTAIFPAATVSKYGADYIQDVVKSDSDYAVEEDVLAQINADGGYYTIAKGVDAKTTYYVIVWATNGSRDDFAIASYTTDPLPYVWNSLGVGEYTDDVMTLFDEESKPLPPYTVSCNVYEEATTPGLYMINGYQLPLFCAIFGVDEATAANYEGSMWQNVDLVINATDPNAVVIEPQLYGIKISNDGWMWVSSYYNGSVFATGKLADGVITFDTKKLLCGFDGSVGYYASLNGAWKLVLPTSAPAAAPAKSYGKGVVAEKEISDFASRIDIPAVKVVYERDPQTVSVKAETLAPARMKRAKNLTVSAE